MPSAIPPLLKNPATELQAGAHVPMSAPGLLENLALLWHELSGHVHDSVSLAILETRLAGQSLVTMIAVGVGVALLLVSAWLCVLAVALLAMMTVGISAILAATIGVVANLAVALVLCQVIRRLSRHLRWAATIRSLNPRPGDDQCPGTS